ncbi:Gfo/Idh/MocA family protein, partial [Faecalibaculum rodentium]
MKYALIGCGRISPNHIQAARNNGLKIAALCDLDREAAIRLIRQFKLEGVAVYADHHTMLEREHPDLVAIVTDSGSHARIALDCLEAGSHVLIEKPMALSLQEADQIIDTARTCGLQVGVCHQNRFNRSVQYIRKAMEAGRFGRLSHGTAHIRWNRSRQYYDQAPWRGTWAQDGGCLMNQGIHSADLLRWMMGGDVEEVMACTSQRQHPYIEGEDLALAIIRFAGGACATLECTTNVYPCNLEETLYLFGEKGTVKAGGISDNIIEYWAFADGLDDPETVKAEYGENPPDIYGYGHTPL